MEKQISRKEYIQSYSKINFSKFSEIINKDSLSDKEYIFSENSITTQLSENDNTKNRFENAYPKLDKYNYGFGSKNSAPIGKNRKFSANINHTSHEFALNGDSEFFDAFDKKVDNNKLSAFKRNFTTSKELIHSISIVNNKLYDNDINAFEEEINSKSNNNNNLETFTADDFFSQADKFLSETENTNKNMPNNNVLIKEDKDLSSDPKIVKIENIVRVNKYLQINVKDPLWYLYHEPGKSSFGPISSDNIAELYRKKVINGETKIRLIDIYSYNNEDNFTYFKLKEIEKSNFINKICISNLVKNAIKLKIGKK